MPIESTSTHIRHLPHAVLPGIDGRDYSITELASGRVSVVFFSCNHCPYVKWVEKTVGTISQQLSEVSWIAICSNDVVTYPDDDVEGLRGQVLRASWSFPYLIDTSQDVARTFGAVCTPDFFVFDSEGILRYRGALDASRPQSDIPVSGEFLRSAIEMAEINQHFPGGKPSLGCGIKWVSEPQ